MAALELAMATTGELRLAQPPPEMGWSAVRYVFAVENVVHVFAVENGGPETSSFGAGAIPDLTLWLRAPLRMSSPLSMSSLITSGSPV